MPNELVKQPFSFCSPENLSSASQAARFELQEILDSGAKSLKNAGLALMPVKREMLHVDDATADLVLDACNLLFAAVLSYEGAQWDIDNAADPIALVNARLEAGRARGVVEALFFGNVYNLLWLAMDRAPIAFYALSEASPDLRIIDRFKR
jgi:hypothetical protein